MMRTLANPSAAYEAEPGMSRGVVRKRREGREDLAPDDSFLIQQIINHLDTVPHLCLRALRHRDDGPNDLSRLDVIEGRNSIPGSLLKFLSVTCQTALRRFCTAP